MFDPQDHFKGNYHKTKLPEGTAGQVFHPQYGWIDSDLAKKLEEFSPRNFEETLKSQQANLNILPESEYTYIIGGLWFDEMNESSEPEKSIDICEHDPVDVGFSKSKLVCKKCDKDL